MTEMRRVNKSGFPLCPTHFSSQLHPPAQETDIHLSVLIHTEAPLAPGDERRLL